MIGLLFFHYSQKINARITDVSNFQGNIPKIQKDIDRI